MRYNLLFKRIFPIIITQVIFCGYPFTDQEPDVVRNIYKEITEDINNKYVIIDSTIITLDSLPFYYCKIGEKQYYYNLTADWVGGLEAVERGRYATKIINTIEDSISTVDTFYSYNRYSRPIKMDDGTYTFLGEDTLSAFQNVSSTIIINNSFGILYERSSKIQSNGFDGHSSSNVYLKRNDKNIPTGKLINEFNAKRNILSYDSIWLKQ